VFFIWYEWGRWSIRHSTRDWQREGELAEAAEESRIRAELNKRAMPKEESDLHRALTDLPHTYTYTTTKNKTTSKKYTPPLDNTVSSAKVHEKKATKKVAKKATKKST